MSHYEIKTQPAVEPVTLAEAKTHAIVEADVGSADDDLIAALIVAARRHVERATNKTLITTTWSLFLNQWPGLVYGDNIVRGAPAYLSNGSIMQIKRGPFQAVTGIYTLSEDGAETEFSGDGYYSNPDRGGGLLALRGGYAWPTPTRSAAGIRIDFEAGYGASAEFVPGDLRRAVLMLVAHWYEHREAVATGPDANPIVSAGIPNGFGAIVSSHRRLRAG